MRIWQVRRTSCCLRKHYEDLLDKANKSLKKLAQEKGMSVVSPEELRELKENAEKPLDVRAKEQGKTVVGIEEFEKPSLEYLKECCKKHLKKIVLEEDYEQLQLRANQTVEEKAKSMGLVVIKPEELDQLKNRLNLQVWTT